MVRKRARRVEQLSVLVEPPADLAVEHLQLGGDSVLAVLSFEVPRDAALATLSPALREVAARVVAGDSNAEIAKRRGTAVRTVANQIAAIFDKLEVRSRRELIARMRGGA
jgi:DNA-binding CsgD family transcriptional regulator